MYEGAIHDAAASVGQISTMDVDHGHSKRFCPLRLPTQHLDYSLQVNYLCYLPTRLNV
jgi:hypothetical protein